MRKICDGSMLKEQVIEASIQMYQRAFETAEAQSDILINSVAKYMDDTPMIIEENEDDVQQIVKKCSKCSNAMVLKRLQSQKLMIGCTGYPNCKDALFIPDFVTKLNIMDEICNNCSTPLNPSKLFELTFKRASVPLTYGSPVIFGPLHLDGCLSMVQY